MKRTAFLLFTAFILTSCMHPPAGSGDYMASNPQTSPEESERIQALREAGKDFSRIVTVPAARDPVSIGIALAALKASGSAPADLLLDILRAGKEPAVAVVGKSDMLTVATIESVVQQLGKPASTVLLFAGSSKDIERLQQLADKAGIPFEGVPFPVSAPEPDTPNKEETAE